MSTGLASIFICLNSCFITNAKYAALSCRLFLNKNELDYFYYYISKTHFLNNYCSKVEMFCGYYLKSYSLKYMLRMLEEIYQQQKKRNASYKNKFMQCMYYLLLRRPYIAHNTQFPYKQVRWS